MKRALFLALSLAAVTAAAHSAGSGPPLGKGGAAAELPPEWRAPLAWQNWRFARPVTLDATSTARLVKITLPPEVYGRAQESLADLRLIDDNGAEVPSVLEVRRGRISTSTLKAHLGEVSFVPHQYTQALIDAGPEPTVHNSLLLETDEKDFFARAEVAASDDLPRQRRGGRTWRILREQAPLYRFPQQGLPGNLTISYPETTATHLRLRIRGGPEPFQITGVKLSHEVREEAEQLCYPGPFVAAVAAGPGQSWWQLDLGAAGVPANAVRFATPQEQFDRRIEVRTSDDAEVWTPVGAGDIHRTITPVEKETLEALEVAFNEARGRYWRVVVFDHDDPPLANLSLTLCGTPRHLVFRQEPGRSYRLLYGNSRTGPPQYEMAKLADPASLAAAPEGALGAEQENAGYVDPSPWSEQHPVVLWVALGLVVAVLGWLALRTLRQPG